MDFSRYFFGAIFAAGPFSGVDAKPPMFDHVGFNLLYRAVSFRDLFNAELRRIGDFDYLTNERLGRHFARAYRSENSLTSLCEAAGRAYRDQGGR